MDSVSPSRCAIKAYSNSCIIASAKIGNYLFICFNITQKKGDFRIWVPIEVGKVEGKAQEPDDTEINHYIPVFK